MITELVREMTLKVMICTQSQSAGTSLENECNKTQSQSAGTSLEHFAMMDGHGFFLGSTPFYPIYFFDQQQQRQQRQQQQFGPFMNELHS